MEIIDYNSSAYRSLERKLGAGPSSPAQLSAARRIVRQVETKGDRALRELTLEFDGVKLKSFRVSKTEIASARRLLTPELKKAFRRVEKNIAAYQGLCLKKSWRKGRGDGLGWGEKITPIEKVGIYIPGGVAPLVSTVFMTVVPARLAGAPRIILITPPQTDGSASPYILAAADYLGVKEIYKVGGAQAIAALAFGTESIPKVDKIVGPGNIYVTLAKKEVFGIVDIDLPAGPSEVAILADGSAPPRYVAADLLAQAEHGVGGWSALITPSKQLLRQVSSELDALLNRLNGKAALRKTLREGAFLIKVKSIKEGLEAVNRLAPEHLEIMTKKPEKVLPGIKNAGAVFLGNFSPVAGGDYLAGPSHVLPTGGSARFSSGLSVNDFLKASSVIRYTKKALKNDNAALQALANIEGLSAHGLSVKTRLDDNRAK